MILRAWVEAGSEKPLRVRVRLESSSEARDKYFADPADVGRFVEEWLSEIQVAK